MLINWFTVGAQIVNFAILILLLKRFLYGPIMRAMQEREKMIARRLEAAESKRKEARQRSEELEKEKRELTQAKEQILSEAKETVAAWKEKELEQIREQIRRMRQAWVDSVEQDKQAFIQQLKRNVTCQTLMVSRKAICDLAGEDLERLAVKRFAEQIRKAVDEGRRLVSAISGTVTVNSGFEMDPGQREELTQALKSHFPSIQMVQFDVNRAIGFGIELMAGDWKVGWNLAVYLKRLEDEILKSLSAACGETP